MFWRFFRIESGPVLERYIELHKKEVETSNRYHPVLKAEGITYGYGRDPKNMLFTLDHVPGDEKWKRVMRGRHVFYRPKRTTKEGQELHKRLMQLPVLPDPSVALRDVGLTPGLPAIVWDGRGYYPYVSMLDPDKPMMIVRLPWREVSAEEMDRYKQEREAGQRACSELNYLSWEPPQDWVEIKEWEALKLADEMSERIRRAKG